MEKKETYKEMMRKFSSKKILVIGDFCLDEYIHGEAEEMSPEYLVPWTFVTKKEYIPGAAGNITCGFNALGAEVYAVGVIGDDINGKILVDEMSGRGINVSGMVLSKTRRIVVNTNNLIFSFF